MSFISVAAVEARRVRGRILPLLSGEPLATAVALFDDAERTQAVDEDTYASWSAGFIAAMVDQVERIEVASAILEVSRIAVSDRRVFDDTRVFSQLIPLADRRDTTDANRVLVDDLVYARFHWVLKEQPMDLYLAEIDRRRDELGDHIYRALFHDGLKRWSIAELQIVLGRAYSDDFRRATRWTLATKLATERRFDELITALGREPALIRDAPHGRRKSLYKHIVAAGLPETMSAEVSRLLDLRAG